MLPTSPSRYDAILLVLPALLVGGVGVAYATAVSLTVALAVGCLCAFCLLAEALLRNPPTDS